MEKMCIIPKMSVIYIGFAAKITIFPELFNDLWIIEIGQLRKKKKKKSDREKINMEHPIIDVDRWKFVLSLFTGTMKFRHF